VVAGDPVLHTTSSRAVRVPGSVSSAADRQKNHERFLLERFIEAAELKVEIVEEREAPIYKRMAAVETQTVAAKGWFE
jgi:hypothetical protein